MRTAIIIQARMGSSRLPGKIMMDLAGRTVLWHVVARCLATPGTDVVCCATTVAPQDAAVAAEAERYGAVSVRGSEENVLDRYLQAARAVGAEVILRVTCDCPLIDPEVNAAVLRLRAAEEADYAANNMPPGWPHGLDCEAFTLAALERAAANAETAQDRGEFVTPWLRRHPSIRRANLAGPGDALMDQRWTLDYPEDMAFFRALHAHLPPPPHLAGWREVAGVLAARPGLSEINRSRRVPGRRGLRWRTQMALRPATREDGALLFVWRNDPATRNASRNTGPVGRDEHAAWLDRSLGDPGRSLFIAEIAGHPVGVVRIDRMADGAGLSWAELSWTVAPEQRGKGYGSAMVALAADRAGGPVRADIRNDNLASQRIAAAAGFSADPAGTEVTVWRR